MSLTLALDSQDPRSSMSLRKQFNVTTLRSLHRRQHYVLVLDLTHLTLDWHKLRKGIEVRRSFPIHSCLKLERHAKDPTCLTVMFNAPSSATPTASTKSSAGASNGASGSVTSSVWQKLVFFESGDDRELFCNVVHAAIASGDQALALYHSSKTSADCSVEDFAEFLIAFCAAQQKLDTDAINSANHACSNDNVGGSTADLTFHPSLQDMFGFHLYEGEVVVTQCQRAARIIPQRDASVQANLESSLIVSSLTSPLAPPTASSNGTHSSGPAPSSRGNLFVTNYRIIFRDYRLTGNAQPQQAYSPSSSPSVDLLTDCDVSLGSIARVTRPSPTLSSLGLLCKDGRKLEFVFDASLDWADTFQKQLTAMAHHGDQSRVFAFDYGRAVRARVTDADSGSCECDGWHLYDAQKEFTRLGLANHSRFRVTRVNSDWLLSPTYPRLLVVPAAMTDEALKSAATHRSRGRIPAVVYLHPITGATLSRSSQPMAGLKGKRNEQDEQLIDAIRTASLPLSATAAANNPDRTFVIVDARPYKAAMGNTVMGKGYENVSHYNHTVLHFMNIDNIHAIRHAYEKLQAITEPHSVDDSVWLSKLEQTQWLHYVRLLLIAAVRIANCLSLDGCSVLVHCSDGWDRTAQITALVQLMLDSHCRTLTGFATLIEKEFLSFGHQFAERFGHCEGDDRDHSQQAPIFLQFLDCVYQCLRQFPHRFEFTEDFLIAVVDECVNHRFGTFLYNSESERLEHQCPTLTVSAWTHLLSDAQRAKFTNRLYDQLSAAPCVPDCSAKRVLVWERFHLRWDFEYVRTQWRSSLSSLAQSQSTQSAVRKAAKLEVKYHTIKSKLAAAGLDLSQFDDTDDDDDSREETAIESDESVRSRSGTQTMDDLIVDPQQRSFASLSLKERRALIAKTLSSTSMKKLSKYPSHSRPTITRDTFAVSIDNTSQTSSAPSPAPARSPPPLPPALPPRPATSPVMSVHATNGLEGTSRGHGP